MNKKYYDILELQKDCSDDDIKKSYRKLAMKWHPDKHMNDNENLKKQAEEKFKDINQAYEILGDSDKRKQYDEFGENVFTNNNNYQFNNASNVYNSFFKSFNMTDSFSFADSMPFFNHTKQREIKDEPILIDLGLTLEELYNGTHKKMKIERKNYNGKNVQNESEILTVNVMPGWKEGTKITFNNKGDIKPNIEPADIIFTIKQKAHNTYSREDNNLIMIMNISYDEVLNGFEKKIINIKGKLLNLNICKGVIKESNYVHRIRGEGMPIRKEGKIIGHGDLIIKFNIIFIF